MVEKSINKEQIVNETVAKARELFNQSEEFTHRVTAEGGNLVGKHKWSDELNAMVAVGEAKFCQGLSPEDFLRADARTYQNIESISEGDGYKISQHEENIGLHYKDRLYLNTVYKPWIEVESGDMIWLQSTKGNEPEESDQHVIA